MRNLNLYLDEIKLLRKYLNEIKISHPKKPLHKTGTELACAITPAVKYSWTGIINYLADKNAMHWQIDYEPKMAYSSVSILNTNCLVAISFAFFKFKLAENVFK